MRCRICGSDENHPTYNVKEMMIGTGDTFTYFDCINCNCLQILDPPEDMSTYYPDSYYSFSMRRWDNPLLNLLTRKRNKAAIGEIDILGWILNYLKPPYLLSPSIVSCIPRAGLEKGSKILDVGCGNGALMSQLRDVGFTNGLGVDPFINNDISYDNGQIILKRELSELEGKWDLVMFNHSFEHMWNLQEILTQVKRLLSPNGLCMIRVPVIPSYSWKRYGKNWIQLDAPRHFHIFSKKSMKLLCEENDLFVEDILYDSEPFQFSGSERYEQIEREQSENLKDSSKTPPPKMESKNYKKMSVLLNKKEEGDQAAFYIRLKP